MTEPEHNTTIAIQLMEGLAAVVQNHKNFGEVQDCIVRTLEPLAVDNKHWSFPEVTGTALEILGKTPEQYIPRTLAIYSGLYPRVPGMDIAFRGLFDITKIRQDGLLEAGSAAIELCKKMQHEVKAPAHLPPGDERAEFFRELPLKPMIERYRLAKDAWLGFKRLRRADPGFEKSDRKVVEALCRKIAVFCAGEVGLLKGRREWVPATRKLDHWMDWDDGGPPVPIYKDVPGYWNSVSLREWWLKRRLSWLGGRALGIASRYERENLIAKPANHVGVATRPHSVGVAARPDSDALARGAAAAKLREAVRKRFG